MSNALSSDSLTSFIINSLPKNTEPSIKSPTDAIAVACHAGMLAVGFRLVGLGEEHHIEAHSEANDARPLPKEWNESSSPAFRYKHDQSSMEYLLKVNRLGNKTVAYGIGVGDDRTTSFDLTTKDFISESSLPYSISQGRESEASPGIHSIFISANRLADLGTLLRTNIIQKLLPSLQKEGYEETSTQASAQNNQRETDDPNADRRRNPREPYRPGYDPLRDDPVLPNPARPHPLADPTVGPQRPPMGDFPPPGFEDEYEMNRPPRGYPRAPGGLGNIGERDLYPPGMGPNDPLRVGGVGPGFGRPRGGGGMHPTFDDPMFGGQGETGPYDPRAPPGARYDPVGPGDGPRFGRGGGPPNPFGGFGSGDFI